jgi:hypothetical protein
VAWGQDELRADRPFALNEKHVAAGAVEQRCKYLMGSCWAIFAEDALVGDSAGDLDSGQTRDIAKNLVEAGVAGGDLEQIVRVGDLCATGGTLGRSEGRGWWRCRWWSGWQGG